MAGRSSKLPAGAGRRQWPAQAGLVWIPAEASNVTEEALNGCVELPPELTRETFEPVLAAVKTRFHSPVDLTFDCSSLQAIDVVGLQLLLAVARQFRAAGKECRFEGMSDAVVRTIRVSGLSEFILRG